MLNLKKTRILVISNEGAINRGKQKIENLNKVYPRLRQIEDRSIKLRHGIYHIQNNEIDGFGNF